MDNSTQKYHQRSQITSSDIICDSLFEIVRGRTRDLSLTYVQTQENNFYSFLNQGWGFVADVDIESERYRILGGARFTVGCLVRVANLRKYHGMVSYMPVEGDFKPNEGASLSKPHGDSLIDSQAPSIITQHECNVTLTSFAANRSSSFCHQSHVESPSNYSQKPRSSSYQTDKQSTYPPSQQIGDGIHSQSDKPDAINEIASNNSNNLKYVSQTSQAPVIEHAADLHVSSDESVAPYHLLNNLMEPIPDKWSSLEDTFVWITPINISHFGADMYMMPGAKLEEEIIHLYCLKSSVGKVDLLKILLAVKDGKHFDISPEHAVVIPCRAFRLEPFVSHTGYMTVDGELIDDGPMQGSVTPVKAKVMCSEEESSCVVERL